MGGILGLFNTWIAKGGNLHPNANPVKNHCSKQLFWFAIGINTHNVAGTLAAAAAAAFVE